MEPDVGHGIPSGELVGLQVLTHPHAIALHKQSTGTIFTSKLRLCGASPALARPDSVDLGIVSFKLYTILRSTVL